MVVILLCRVTVQIMLRLNQQDRPDVPPLDTLPGQPLPGVAAYIQLMKVCPPSVSCDARLAMSSS